MRDVLKSNTGYYPNIKDPENIRNLYIGHNNINNVDFSPFINLESLDIGHNNITDISSLPISLKWLCIADNPITNFDRITELVNLKTLWAHQTKINIDNWPQLNHLLLDDCELTTIDSLKNLPLKTLELKNNKICSIDVIYNMSLTFLNICNNNVKDLGPISFMGSLKKLNVKNNPIQDYSPIKTLNLRRLSL